MYIFTNALKNITRNLGRNVLIAVIIFAIITTTVVALIINNTSAAVIEDYKNRFGSEVSVTPDMQKVMEEARASSTGGMVRMIRPTLEPELELSLANSPALQKTEATARIDANSPDVRAIGQAEDDDGSTAPSAFGGMRTQAAGGGNGNFAMSFGGGNFRLLGDDWGAFDSGDRALADDGASRFPEADGECVISADVASENGVSLGDTVTFLANLSLDAGDRDTSGWADGGTTVIDGVEYAITDPTGNGDMFMLNRTVTLELTVVGFYDDMSDTEDGAQAAQNPKNEVITTLNILLAARAANESGVTVTVKYYLKSPDLLADFESYARAAGLPDTFLVTTDSSSYETVVKPVLSMKSISLTFMVVVLVLGAIILLLLTSIAIRERKYEIGVLRAMGMKKSRVAVGLWAELLTITAACLVVGILTGSAISQPVAGELIKRQAETAESSQNMPYGAPGGGNRVGNGGGQELRQMSTRGMGILMPNGASAAKPLSEIDVKVGLDTILEIAGIALLLSTLAGLSAIAGITKYEPMKILTERN